ncbi:hypothetical protein BDN70DRAFT_882335 [Pholiota conissans]|uniref:CID domain-containing protein n=1 Tax=Pholiota conissans TaxID=109636 RepID=A0A9P5YXS0_9AGAR|nr:hypothetical protein BDN70DRAFT_882335 [Pholiota conissans]
MSIYSQNLYGSPSYGSQNYSSSPGGYQYYSQHIPQPPAPPTYHVHVDADSFRRDFSSRLSELTFNSRPAIQQLSMCAQDGARYAGIVAQCLEAHIRRVPPWMKLPAFYLLDAISKNVYEPYARQFSSFVVSLFLETYPVVDDNTRGKMEEMLLTWRTGSPMGKELFGVQQQIAIERGVWGGGAASSSGSNFYSGSGVITKSQVLSELQFTLGQKERALQANPYDTTSQNHITILHQLRLHVEAGVSQEELQQILSQLRNMVKSTIPPPIPQPSIPAPTWHPQPPFPPPVSFQQPSAAIKVEPRTFTPLVADVKAVPTEPAIVPPDNIANLLSTLLKAGVVSASSTPTGAGSTATDKATIADIPKAVDSNETVIREYRDSILSEAINLNALDSIRSSRIVEFLYERQGLQCRQCGLRFADTALGKKNQDNHLDMHFRQNRKANENIDRGHSRSWFVGLDDWIQETSTNDKGKASADGPSRATKFDVAAETSKREAKLRAQYVVVPAGDEAQLVSCPICKETLKSEFLEDDEEWVWKNAMKKDGKIYHATCFAEAITSTTLAARLRNEKAHGSRSATPEVASVPSIVRSATPPPLPSVRASKSKSPSLSPTQESKLLGTKRKVKHGDANISEEPTGTPPLKKVALSAPSS